MNSQAVPISRLRFNQVYRMFQSTFAEDNTSMEGMKLLDVINTVKPTILIGLSGCGGIFTGQLRLNLSRAMVWVKRSENLRILIDIT